VTIDLFAPRSALPPDRLGVVFGVLGGCTAPGTTRAAPRAAQNPTPAAALPTLPSAKDIAAFEGEGNETTKAFTVPELGAALDGPTPRGRFSSSSSRVTARLAAVLSASLSSSRETTFVAEEGEFKLRVKAEGKWSIRIISRPPNTATG
jgi:hypothetical protein